MPLMNVITSPTWKLYRNFDGRLYPESCRQVSNCPRPQSYQWRSSWKYREAISSDLQGDLLFLHVEIGQTRDQEFRAALSVGYHTVCTKDFSIFSPTCLKRAETERCPISDLVIIRGLFWLRESLDTLDAPDVPNNWPQDWLSFLASRLEAHIRQIEKESRFLSKRPEPWGFVPKQEKHSKFWGFSK
jgi:hypothetical protein